jgi:hypothetical protein
MPANKYPRAADPKQGICIQETPDTSFWHGANLFCEYSDAEIHIWGN